MPGTLYGRVVYPGWYGGVLPGVYYLGTSLPTLGPHRLNPSILAARPQYWLQGLNTGCRDSCTASGTHARPQGLMHGLRIRLQDPRIRLQDPRIRLQDPRIKARHQ